MDALFSTLADALGGSVPAAVGGALLWGVLSILLSPCHLAGIPLIVGFIGRQESASNRRAFRISLVFSLGILATIAAIGIVTATLGRMLGDVGGMVNYLLALIFVALGLHFLGVIPIPWEAGGLNAAGKRGLTGAFLLGLVFGIGVGPCTFAFMAPVLGVTLKVAASGWLRGVGLLAAYGIGHCAVIVVAGTSAQLVQRTLAWNEGSLGATRLRQACGVLVILGGLYLVYSAP